MREIGQDLSSARKRVETLMGIPLLLKVSEGRGRSTIMKGTILRAFPSIFTVRLDSGEIKTFSYNDVHTKSILFLKPE